MSYDFDAMSRDEVILDLVKQGMSLNKASKEYVKLKKAAGYAVGVASHKDAAVAYLIEQAPASPIEPKPLVKALVDKFEVTESTAMGYIRAYAEEHNLEVKSRSASTEVLDWIVANAPMTVDEDWDQFDEAFIAWMESEGKSRNNINEYRKGLKLHVMLINR